MMDAIAEGVLCFIGAGFGALVWVAVAKAVLVIYEDHFK